MTGINGNTAWLNEVLGPELSYPAGVTLFREDASITTVYLVLSGVVKLFTMDRGRQALIALRTSGWLLSAMPAVLGLRHSATAITLTETVIRSISAGDFHLLRRSNIDAGDWIQAMLAQEALEQQARSVALTLKRARPYVEYIFVELFRAAGVHHSNASLRLSVPISVTDLAALSGVSRQWLTELLAEYQATRVVVKDLGWYVLPESSRLMERVRGRQSDIVPHFAR